MASRRFERSSTGTFAHTAGISLDSSSFGNTAESQAFALKRIGAGSCGTTLGQDGHHAVYKLQKNLFGGKVADLHNDFVFHRIIRQAIISVPSVRDNIKVPELYGWVSRTDAEFWEDNENYFEGAVASHSRLPCNILKSERILPLPDSIRAKLIDSFCPLDLRENAHRDQSNRDCLIRIYLGRIKEEDGRRRRYFSLRNFQMHLNQMLQVGADVHELARSMAGMLAAVQWQARVDAKDVEFVLGCSTIGVSDISITASGMISPDTSVGHLAFHEWDRREIRMWLLDFNLCSHISMDEAGVAMAAEPWRLNDPYYPRPLQTDNPVAQGLWNTFASSYLEVSDLILENTPHMCQLPRKFIDRIVDIEKRRLENRAERLSRNDLGAAGSDYQ